MDPNATPWRVLEDPADQSTGGAAAPASPALPRSVLLIGGGAVLLGMLAFVLAFGTGAGGSVFLEGGSRLESLAGPTGPGGTLDAIPGSGLELELVVEIVGAVDRPGVFRLPSGSRVGDLVAAAGGYGARVDADRASRDLNLAAPLHDGDQIRVPSRDDEPSSGQRDRGSSATGSGADTDAAGPLDLNRATSAELEALPGIGPVTAGKILSSREEQRFTAVDDLRTRKLVGQKTFETLKDLVTVR